MASYISCNWEHPTVPSKLKLAILDLAEISPCLCFNKKALINKGLGLIRGYGWIAGGALRSRIGKDGGSDLDLYFNTNCNLVDTYFNIRDQEKLKAKVVIDDQYLISLETTIGKIDLVKQYYNKPRDCIEDFDFTVCCFALDNLGNVTWNTEAIKHIEERKLIFNNIERNPSSAIMRIAKYVQKGYTIDLKQIEIITKQLNKTNKKDIDNNFDKLKTRNHSYVNKNTKTLEPF